MDPPRANWRESRTPTRVRTAIIPAAGLGTRMQPATRAVPKELLPVGGRPAIDWILDEAASAGLERAIVVLNRSKPAIEAYLTERSEPSRTTPWGSARAWKSSLDVELVYQHRPKGLGDAVRVGRDACSGEPVAVLLPDEIMLGGSALLSSMVTQFTSESDAIVSLSEVPWGSISAYGCAELDGWGPLGTRRVRGCVEKPDADAARSNFAICGRYVLGAGALAALDTVSVDTRGEIQLTPVLDGAARGGEVLGIEVTSDHGRVDVGNWSGWLQANCAAFSWDERANDQGRHLRPDLARDPA